MKLIKITRTNEILTLELANNKNCYFRVNGLDIKFLISDSPFNEKLFANTAKTARIDTKTHEFIVNFSYGKKIPQHIAEKMKALCGFHLVEETEEQKIEREALDRKVAISDWVVSGEYDRE